MEARQGGEEAGTDLDLRGVLGELVEFVGGGQDCGGQLARLAGVQLPVGAFPGLDDRLKNDRLLRLPAPSTRSLGSLGVEPGKCLENLSQNW